MQIAIWAAAWSYAFADYDPSEPLSDGAAWFFGTLMLVSLMLAIREDAARGGSDKS